jgi:CRP-like cAMP-binding protein
VHFIETGLASVVAISGRDRRQSEVAIVGREGMTGVAAALYATKSPCEIFMQTDGTGKRIEAGRLLEIMEQSLPLRRILLQAVHVFHTQTAFNALASAHGCIEERLARWILMAHDRIKKNELEITHEFLALMLGVRRAGVTTAINALELRGLLTGMRGAVIVLDREGLEETAHGLYGQPEAEFDRLFIEPLATG